MTVTDTCWSWELRDLLPRPIPSRYGLVPPDEQSWRGRASIAFWLLGYSVATTWRVALSRDPQWAS